jgi:hypothetical protein
MKKVHDGVAKAQLAKALRVCRGSEVKSAPRTAVEKLINISAVRNQ